MLLTTFLITFAGSLVMFLTTSEITTKSVLLFVFGTVVTALVMFSIFVANNTSLSSEVAKPGKTYTVCGKERKIPDNLKMGFTPYMVKEEHLSNMVRLLEQVDKFHTDHGKRYWIFEGTVLGQVRHGGIIPWDSDMDVYTDEPITDPKLWHDAGLELREHNTIYRVSFTGQSYPFVDYVPARTVDGVVRICGRPTSNGDCISRIDDKSESAPEYMVFPLKRVPFETIEVSAPGNAKAYVSHAYGEKAIEETAPFGWRERYLPWIHDHRISAAMSEWRS